MPLIKIAKDIDNTPFLKGDVIECSESHAKVMIASKEAVAAAKDAKPKSKEELLKQLEAKKKKIAEKAKEKAKDAGVVID